MDSIVIKLLIMVIAALLATMALIGLEVKTHTGTTASYSLKGAVGVVLLGVLISLLTVR